MQPGAAGFYQGHRVRRSGPHVPAMIAMEIPSALPATYWDLSTQNHYLAQVFR